MSELGDTKLSVRSGHYGGLFRSEKDFPIGHIYWVNHVG